MITSCEPEVIVSPHACADYPNLSLNEQSAIKFGQRLVQELKVVSAKSLDPCAGLPW